MRTGLSVSAVTHAVILAVILLGLGKPNPFSEPPVDSITVDLVPLSSVSNVRAGVLDSKIVDTKTPAVVKDTKPAELAQPTGNTQKDQPKPERSDTPTPAPTVQTAPEPVAQPTPKPEPAPPTPPPPQPAPSLAPEPTPQPPPAPAPAPAPEAPPSELAAAPTTPETPADTAPQPSATDRLAQLRADFKKQQQAQKQAEAEAKALEEQKQAEAKAQADARQQDKAAKAADEINQIINAENTRGATTGEGGTPSLGKPTGQSATLSQSDVDALIGQIDKCLNVPIGAKDAGTTAELMINFNQDGSVNGVPQVTRQPADSLEQALASAAVRAVMACGPYDIVAQKYDQLAQVQVLVDPSKF